MYRVLRKQHWKKSAGFCKYVGTYTRRMPHLYQRTPGDLCTGSSVGSMGGRDENIPEKTGKKIKNFCETY